jgi:hypothetical protein
MTVVEVPSGTRAWLGGRFRLDERISVSDHIGGPCATSWEARGLSLWKATDQLLGRPVTIYLLPPGIPVPPAVVEAVQAAAKVCDARLATIYDTDFASDCPYVVSEWTPGTQLEDLVLSGLPAPALAAAMIADAADALAIAQQAGRPHLRLTPRSLRWDNSSGLKITGLGLDAALCGPASDGAALDGLASDFLASDGAASDFLASDFLASGGGVSGGAVSGGLASGGLASGGLADTRALARMLYALLTGYWPGEDATALPTAPRHKGQVCTPRQVRAGVPAILDVITYRALSGQAPNAPARPLAPAGLAVALRGVQRPSYQLVDPPEDVGSSRVPGRTRHPARHARARSGVLHRTSLLHPAA